jgi:hypothetical protein
MADDPKIIPSPPPAEPVDVDVSPSPPPARPFDVPIYPSPPPRDPFDVKIYPDPPPAGTVDVKVSLDPGPREPVDVTTSPDAPPRKPVDVPTNPSGPPLAPFDVPVAFDPGPRQPVDVPTTPDLPPAAPSDVPIVPDPPPAAPFNVPIVPDPPSAAPFNVPITLDPPPATPFDVPIALDPPPVLLEGGPDNVPTLAAIINAVKDFDGTLGAFLAGLHQISPISISIQGAGALDPTVLAAWFRDYTQTVGLGNVGKFISQQEALFAMNPVAARIFNPLYFLAMSFPGAMGHVHATVDTMVGRNAQTIALVRDDALAQKVNLFGIPELAVNVYTPEKTAVDGQEFSVRIPELAVNVYTPEKTAVDGQEFSIDEMIDAAVDDVRHPYMSTKTDRTAGIPVKVFDASLYFQERGSDGAQLVRADVRDHVGRENLQSREAGLANSAFIDGIIPMRISQREDPDGSIYTQTDNPTGFVDDDDARIPLCFTDLRKTPRGYRTIYFRPLNLSFSTAISPEWSEDSAFGRVDPVVGYKQTSRTYSVSFELHAFAPEDLKVMYQKMTWLDSMCYPSYGSDSLIKSGPVIRLRIGDAVNTETGGLSGIIKGLSYDFADALWELKKGFKVPRSFKVSLDFLALHEGPVGVMNGAFGVFKLPLVESNNFVDSALAGAEQSKDAPTEEAQIVPGMFSKFGEPRRK